MCCFNTTFSKSNSTSREKQSGHRKQPQQDDQLTK